MKNDGFRNPIAPKMKEKKIRSPWNFEAPPYDQRSGCAINAGTDYGTGFNVPIGTSGKPSANAKRMPDGCKRIDIQENPDSAEVI